MKSLLRIVFRRLLAIRQVRTFFRAELRAELYEEIRDEMRRDRIQYFNSLPRHELSTEAIQSCRLLPSRFSLIELLPKHSVIAEVGVDEGEFTEELLRVVNPRKLHLIDAWAGGRYPDQLAGIVAARFKDQIARGVVEINRGFSDEVLATFPDEYFDWLYVDTNHSFETTRKELAVAAKKVKEGGIIAGHDFLTYDFAGGCMYGVVEAVHEFVCLNDWEFVYLTSESNRYISYAIRQRGLASVASVPYQS